MPLNPFCCYVTTYEIPAGVYPRAYRGLNDIIGFFGTNPLNLKKTLA